MKPEISSTLKVLQYLNQRPFRSRLKDATGKGVETLNTVNYS